jgi:hypothetical protein
MPTRMSSWSAITSFYVSKLIHGRQKKGWKDNTYDFRNMMERPPDSRTRDAGNVGGEEGDRTDKVNKSSVGAVPHTVRDPWTMVV